MQTLAIVSLGKARRAGVRQGGTGSLLLCDTDLGKSIPGRESGECKGPEAGWDLEITLKCWAPCKWSLIGFPPPILQELGSVKENLVSIQGALGAGAALGPRFPSSCSVGCVFFLF